MNQLCNSKIVDKRFSEKKNLYSQSDCLVYPYQLPSTLQNLLLALESTSRRMSQLAKNEIYFGEYISMDKLIEGIDLVTPEDVLRVAGEFLRPEQFVTVILNPAKQ